MEYTKDIILEMGKEGVSTKKESTFLNFLKENKIILSLIGITFIFIFFDFLLLNSFISLLGKI